ncbi:hypothetical protein KGM_209612 [Danaus plexippus plexippus]|uniref:Uncharacterized protein n=1 Tax=Danaus plexippus plexippus TaxID=278856 RepID=A0A212EVL3_DANPL|nr:hypothetical protein KGM_209612 [Danaus plexippus plexippus]
MATFMLWRDEVQRSAALEMRSKQQPRPSYRWLGTNENVVMGVNGRAGDVGRGATESGDGHSSIRVRPADSHLSTLL